jgi:uncharacterized protein with GYD domain
VASEARHPFGSDLPYREQNYKTKAPSPLRSAGALQNKKEDNMPTYIALLNWTQQGIAKVKDSPSRLDAGREAFKKMGVQLKDTYLTMGRYDLVCVIEAPDDEAYAKAVLALGSQGNVSTETLKAFTEDQYRKITGSL